MSTTVTIELPKDLAEKIASGRHSIPVTEDGRDISKVRLDYVATPQVIAAVKAAIGPTPAPGTVFRDDDGDLWVANHRGHVALVSLGRDMDTLIFEPLHEVEEWNGPMTVVFDGEGVEA